MINLKKLREVLNNAVVKFGSDAVQEVSASTVLELLDMLEVAQKDAARYRWIRKNKVAHGETIDRIYQDQVVYFSFGLNGNNMDEAIDAAMQS